MNNDCGCGTPNNLNILQDMNNVNHVNMNQQNMNQQNMNQQNMNQANNMNQQNLNQNALNQAVIMQNAKQGNVEPVGPLNNLVLGNNINNIPKKKVSFISLNDIKIIVYILTALSINEAIRFFIPQYIRLNRGSSSTYIYYSLICIGILIGINIFS